MLLYLFLLLSHILGLTAGDTISPDQDQLTGTEGKSLTMKCNYQTDDNFPQLYWYKHDSDLHAPQFLLWKGAKRYSKQELVHDKRYGSRATDTSTDLIISELTLGDTALYYCALVKRKAALTFGNPIKLTVVPEASSTVLPTLFILRPQLRPNAPPTPTSSKSPEVCLALDFRPSGYMRLNGDKALSTSNAPVSTKSKTYFFAGISDEPINTCEMNGVTADPKSDPSNGGDAAPTSTTTKVKPTVKPTKPTVVPLVEDVYPKRSRLNLYTVVMNGVRLLFTKALAFSTILTVKALVF